MRRHSFPAPRTRLEAKKGRILSEKIWSIAQAWSRSQSMRITLLLRWHRASAASYRTLLLVIKKAREGARIITGFPFVGKHYGNKKK